jgi:ABC-type lipoprotein release transport system permease subunit
MAVLERRKEYGILLSLGVGHRRLIALLFAETALLASLGLVVGVFVGGLINAYFANHGIAFEGMEQMAEKFNLPSRIYPMQHFATLLAGPLIVFIGSVCAATYPALKLRKLHPVTARAGL